MADFEEGGIIRGRPWCREWRQGADEDERRGSRRLRMSTDLSAGIEDGGRGDFGDRELFPQEIQAGGRLGP